MERGKKSVPTTGSAFANHVHYTARPVPELSFVARGEHLKFENRILVELSRGPPIHRVGVRHAIDQENGVPASLPHDGRCGIRPGVYLTVDGDARHQLHQIEIVPPINW